ncbi:MAG: NAD+ synthase [Magnetospirillum sp. WYHS-4]
MTDTLAIALAQMDPTVGDVAGNARRILDMRAEAGRQGADLAVFGELAITGYPPDDLILKGAFQRAVEAQVAELAQATRDGGPALLIGAPWLAVDHLYNAALLLDGGDIAAIRFKHELPNYGVFDEVRLFAPGPLPEPIAFRGMNLGVMICEDMWKPAVVDHLGAAGADLLAVLNGSPFEAGKGDTRLGVARERQAAVPRPLVYVNLVGGQDELVFDGGSFALSADGTPVARLDTWTEEVALTRWRREVRGWTCVEAPLAPEPAPLENIYRAVMTGLKDYVGKNRFKGVLIGLSGGIDSALVAALAVDALGADKVHCVMMPSRYTSRESLEDAAEVARLLGIRLDTIGIEPAVGAFGGMLESIFAGQAPDTTEENIQARARGLTLMAISNKFGLMVISTGNKSEMSVGYATLYGDMCGGFAALKDLYKTTVFALSRWRNAHRPKGALGPGGPVMPDRVIVKPPTAELKANQTDQDSLPPYDVLDDILECLIEDEMSQAEIVGRGHDPETVRRVWRLVDGAEYKRRQAPPGVKITRRSFGRDRRYPITNAFRG